MEAKVFPVILSYTQEQNLKDAEKYKANLPSDIFCKIQILDSKNGSVVYEEKASNVALAKRKLYDKSMKDTYWIRISYCQNGTSREKVIQNKLAMDMWAINCPGNCDGECFEHPQWKEYRIKVQNDPELKTQFLQKLYKYVGNGDNAPQNPKILEGDSKLVELMQDYAKKYGDPTGNGAFKVDLSAFEDYVKRKFQKPTEQEIVSEDGKKTKIITSTIGEIGDHKMSLNDYQQMDRMNQDGTSMQMVKYISKYKTEIEQLGKDRGYVWINLSDEKNLPLSGVYSRFDIQQNRIVWNDKKFIKYIGQYYLGISIPIYFYNNQRKWGASVVGLPWIDPAIIIKTTQEIERNKRK